ncbi:hypothetical protein Fmac_020566 [Flemingia macrophylla]|uniref:Serine/threonine-protein kinase ATM n=1 Tax=Flemingia macrophylla TaxID=520843 RepID=A0ABD1LUD9_9FABA
MDVVMTEEPNSGDETKLTEDTIMTEAPQKDGGSGFDSRDRRKSKYLSSPYTNIGLKQKDLPAETDDLMTPYPSQKAEASSVAINNGSCSYAKLGNKRFRKYWYKKFISCNTMSSKRAFKNASADELLSGLYSTAIDCMFPVGSKSFDLVEQFFCRYRVSNYHDEAELATSMVNVKEEKLGKPVSNDLSVSKSKRQNSKKTENTVRRKRKSLSGLSDVNSKEKITSSGDSLMPGRKLKQKRRLKEISVHQPQNVEIDLNGSSSNYSSVPEASQNLSCIASEGKAVHKKREKVEPQMHQSAQTTSVHMDAKSRNCSSIVIDLQFSPPIPADIPKQNKYEKKEELVFRASNPGSSCSQEGPVGSLTDHSLLVSAKAEVGNVLVNKTGLKNTMAKAAEVPLNTKHAVEKTGSKNSMEKAAEKPLNTKLSIGKTGLKNSMVMAAELPLDTIHALGKTGLKNSIEKAVEKPLNTKLAVEIPDLNGTGAECNSISPEFDAVNSFSPELKSEKSKSSFACSRPTNGESRGTYLLLRFAPGANIPSKEDLMTTFCQFGPLNVSETQLLKDIASAQVVFVRNADAAAAFHSLEQNKFIFGSTLVDCKLHHLSATSPPAEQLVTPAQPSGYMTRPGVISNQQNGYKAMPGAIPTQPTVSVAAMPGVSHSQPTGSMAAMPGVTPTQQTGSIAMPGVTPTQQAGLIAMPSVTPTQQTGSMAMPGVAPTQQTGSIAMPGETPPLQFIKQNLQMMTSILENSGNSLTPQMRAKLDTEIKTLMRKVNSRTKA